MPSASSAPTLPFLERLLDGEKVEWKTLGEVGTFVRGTSFQKKHFVEKGVGCIHYGEIYTRYGLFAKKTISYLNEEIANKARKAGYGDLIIATTSENDDDVCKSVAWLGSESIVVSNDACYYHHTLDPKYVAYFFRTDEFQRQKRNYITGTKVKRVNANDLAKITLPIPPLRVQARIVEILDKFTQLEAELEDELAKELEARNKQYDFYRNRLLSGPLPHSPNIPHQWEQVPLGSIGEVRMCKRILKQDTTETGEIPFYKIGTFGKSADAFISRTLFEEYKQKYAYPKIGDILISASGTIGRAIEFDGEDAYFQDSNIVWLEHDSSKVSNRFLYYCYQIADWKVAKGGTISRLYNDNLKKTLIPLPPLSEQRRIVDILDRFDTLTNSISEGLPREIALRRKQYEYYRDALLRFPQPTPTA